MATERHHTDDDIRRWRSIWLGPDKGDKNGFTWPFAASHSAWGIWLIAVCLILAIEAVTPLNVPFPPVRECCVAVLIATYLGGKIDHDRPLRELPRTLLQNLRSPRPITKTGRSDHRFARVRIEDRS